MTEEFEPQADALDAYLQGRHPSPLLDQKMPPDLISGLDPSLSEDALMALRLKNLAGQIQADPEFEAALESRLAEHARKRLQIFQHGARLGRLVLWGGLAAVLLFGLIWALSNLAPRTPSPGAPPLTTQVTRTPEVTATIIEPTLLPSSTPASKPTAESQVYALPIQPDSDFVLQAPFPESPTEVTLYRQGSWDELTVDTALATADQLGVHGKVYLSPESPPGLTSYLIWDGTRQVKFFGSPRAFEFQSGNPAAYEHSSCHPPCSAPGAVAALQAFLSQHNLLDFPAAARPSDSQPLVMELIQPLDGIPLIYSPGSFPGQALVGSQSQVFWLNYQPAKVEPLGSYPILTAEQAWTQAASLHPAVGIEYSSRTAAAADQRLWQRSYPVNEPVDLFGTLQVFQPAQAGDGPLLLLDGYQLEGSLQGMAESAADHPFVQVWGMFKSNNLGGLILQVDGWQRSAFTIQTLSGVILRREGQAFLQSENQTLLLPDLPADVPEGQTLSVSGVVIEEPEPALAWSTISTSFGGGGGGGGGNFLEIQPQADLTPAPTNTPPPQPAPGYRLEGVTGTPVVFIHQYSDGSTRVEVFFNLDPGQPGLELSSAALEGPGLAGIEAYHNLPVKLWGAFSESTSRQPVIRIEQVKPVYPDLELQVWLGRAEPAALDGQNVQLFTTQDGEQYVLAFSVDEPSRQPEFGPGDPIVIEGYVIPDRDLAGFPLIHDLVINLAQGFEQLSDYQPQTLKPFIIKEGGTAGAARKAIVSSIELVYFTENLRESSISAGSPLPYVQPVWRYTGAYEDGSLFQILVQAIDPQYLRQP